jgi:hypothetical protein
MALLDNENKFTPNSAATEPKQPFSLRACADACMQPTVLVLALIKVAGAMAMSVWHSTFYGGVAQADFGIDIQQLGLLTSYMGLLAMLTQVSGLVKYVTVNYDDRSINTAIGLLLALVFFAVAPIAFAGKDVPVLVLGYTTNMASLQFLVLLLPITACFTIVRSISTAQFTKCVSRSHAGTIIGVDMAIGSAVRIVSPFIGASIEADGGLAGISTLCSGLCILMAAFSAVLMGSNEQQIKSKSS